MSVEEEEKREGKRRQLKESIQLQTIHEYKKNYESLLN